MKRMMCTNPAAWVFTSILAGGVATGQAPNIPRRQDNVMNLDADNTKVNPDADNTRVNKRYDGKKESTADQQSNAKDAMETTRRIRSAITDDKTLSTYAHNIKIISQDGEVVLKGPVKNANEKMVVENIATKMAGTRKVTSQLEISSN
jgi:hyperosmotically inducible protein